MGNKVKASLFSFWSVHGLENDSTQFPPFCSVLSVSLVLPCFFCLECLLSLLYTYSAILRSAIWFSVSLLTVVSWHLTVSLWLQFSSSCLALFGRLSFLPPPPFDCVKVKLSLFFSINVSIFVLTFIM